MLKVTFHQLGTIDDGKIEFVVVASRIGGKWVMVRHKERSTWELPGGHREPTESPDEAAHRELFEETGAVEYEIKPVCMYSVQSSERESFGVLYYAAVRHFGPLPESEIGEVGFWAELPRSLTYPSIQPFLLRKVSEHEKLPPLEVVERIETARLWAERLREDHSRVLFKFLYSDPRVMATLGGRVLGGEELSQSVTKGVGHWLKHGFGTWVFFAREDGRFIGRGGLHYYEIDGSTEVGLMYHVAADEWRRGFATEIARASLGVGFRMLRFPSIMSWTLPTNRASARVMEKCGFRYEKPGVFAGLPHEFYRITAGEWFAQCFA